MNTVRYPIEIGDPAGEHFEMLNAWADTGASYTLVRRGIMGKFGSLSYLSWVFQAGKRKRRIIGFVSGAPTYRPGNFYGFLRFRR